MVHLKFQVSFGTLKITIIIDAPENYMYSSARDYAGINGLLDIEFIE